MPHTITNTLVCVGKICLFNGTYALDKKIKESQPQRLFLPVFFTFAFPILFCFLSARSYKILQLQLSAWQQQLHMRAFLPVPASHLRPQTQQHPRAVLFTTRCRHMLISASPCQLRTKFWHSKCHCQRAKNVMQAKYQLFGDDKQKMATLPRAPVFAAADGGRTFFIYG